MELVGFSFFPFLFTFLFIFFISAKTLKGSKARRTIPRSPPGPWKLPLIGNLLQLSGALPHHSLRDLAKTYGPIMHLKLGETSVYVISSAETAKEVLKTNDLVLASRPEIMAVKIISYNATNVVFAPYGPYWRQVRKICVLELLTAKRVQSFRSIREEEVGKFIESISSSVGYAVNLTDKLSKLTNDIISRAAFGKKCEDQVQFIAEVTKILELSSGFDMPDLFPSFKFLHSISRVKPVLMESHCRVDNILDKIISEHKEEMVSGVKLEDEDLLHVLLKVQDSDDLEVPITINNIKAVILDMFIAGSETSSTVMEWAMSEMMRNPRVMERAQAEVRAVFRGKGRIEEADIENLNYLKLVIKETLRLHPPFPLLLPREARERCEINGFEVPIKTRVMINAWAIGRDEIYWTNAERFEPERFSGITVDFKGTNFEFIPFGAGRRMCPGMLFGTANVTLPLANLLYHFNWEPTDGIIPEELDMEETFGVVAKRKKQLRLTSIPYVS